MSPSWSSPQASDTKLNMGPSSRSCLSVRTKRFWAAVVAGVLVIAIALGVGLGLGLNSGSSGSESGSSTPAPPLGNTTNATAGNFWRPTAGTSWQIVLQYALNDTSTNVSVYDIDLFTNSAATIKDLHAKNRSVICYFSAGSYENFRPDSSKFQKSDYANGLDGWPGEYWLNTNSSNVRSIMTTRLDMAVAKGCDGVDPDNVDGYDNNSGFDLTPADGINYMTFLAIEAHSRGLAIGLKNAGKIVNATLDMMQWQVNEQCTQYNECSNFRPFIDANKPVFHIEYPEETPKVTASSICGDGDAKGFSTVLKNMNWMIGCSIVKRVGRILGGVRCGA
jgi:hypothetical protein